MQSRLNTESATVKQKLFLTRLAIKLGYKDLEYIPMTKGEVGRNISIMLGMLKAKQI